jgi:hypothetical protein
MLVTISSDL